ncbi:MULTISPECIES: endonuclease domain-containing protein [unclassified Leucobacter]|uniref:endonuclease domain-containing protein n=1 Tax=unclassified Leucobacter TaxID=2621730 RepID=UPI00165D5DF3|nr:MULTISPECIES: hypothetical protein [unclassified Leucobacter]MBC9935713.1 hypothetical protein [Leucobacter sp. cx-87]
MTKRSAFPPLDGPSYRVRDLLRAGVPARRLYLGDIARPAHGIVIPPTSEIDLKTIDGRCRSMLPVLSPDQFFSRRTAASLWGMPSFGEEPNLLDICSIHPRRAPRRPEIAGHSVTAGRVRIQQLRGLPVASPEDTWCLLGSILPHGQLIAIGDFLVSERHTGAGWKAAAPSSFGRIRAAMIRHRGSRGMRSLTLAIPKIRTGVDSPAETQLRLIIVGGGLPEPRTNCPVPVSGGDLHADLGYDALQIAIEYEGQYHFTGGESQARRDVERWERMTDAGWRVLRVVARDLRDPAPFLGRLARSIETAKGAR